MLGPCPLPPLDTYLPVMILRGKVTRGQAHIRAAVALPLESCSLCSKLPLRGSVHRAPGALEVLSPGVRSSRRHGLTSEPRAPRGLSCPPSAFQGSPFTALEGPLLVPQSGHWDL